jgi:hypothetical protein
LLVERRRELDAVLARVVEARERLEAAQLLLEETRSEAHEAIRRLGTALVVADEATPVGLVRELYWDYPELHVVPGHPRYLARGRGRVTAHQQLEEARRLLALQREVPGKSAPTLGRLLPDTPGVRHTGDAPPTARVVAFEQWAMEDTPDDAP